MALVSCPEPECGRKISDQAVSCPQCGRPLSSGGNAGSTSSAAPQNSVATTNGQDRPWPLVDGRLHLLDDLLKDDLEAKISKVLPFARAGEVTTMTISGQSWTDDDIQKVCDLLLPGSSNWHWSNRTKNVARAQEMFPQLTKLEVTLCQKLTFRAMNCLTRFSSLTEVDLFAWQADINSEQAILQFYNLPLLRKMRLPISLYGKSVAPGMTQLDLIAQVIRKNRPGVEVH